MTRLRPSAAALATTLAIGLGVVVVAIYVAHAGTLIRYPWDWSPDEGMFLDFARRARNEPGSLSAGASSRCPRSTARCSRSCWRRSSVGSSTRGGSPARARLDSARGRSDRRAALAPCRPGVGRGWLRAVAGAVRSQLLAHAGPGRRSDADALAVGCGPAAASRARARLRPSRLAAGRGRLGAAATGSAGEADGRAPRRTAGAGMVRGRPEERSAPAGVARRRRAGAALGPADRNRRRLRLGHAAVVDPRQRRRAGSDDSPAVRRGRVADPPARPGRRRLRSRGWRPSAARPGHGADRGRSPSHTRPRQIRRVVELPAAAARGADRRGRVVVCIGVAAPLRTCPSRPAAGGGGGRSRPRRQPIVPPAHGSRRADRTRVSTASPRRSCGMPAGPCS